MCSLFLHKRQPWFVHNSLTDLKRRTISGSLRRKLKEILVGPTIKQSGTGSCPGDKMATTSRGKSGNGLQPNVPLGSTVAFKCSNPVCLSSLREGTQLSKFFAPFTPRSTDHPHPNLLTPSALGGWLNRLFASDHSSPRGSGWAVGHLTQFVRNGRCLRNHRPLFDEPTRLVERPGCLPLRGCE